MADKDLLLHDAKNCLHALTVNLEAIEDGVIPLAKDAIRPLSQPILTLKTILTQLVQDGASAVCAEEDAFDIVPLLKDLLREEAPLFHKKGIAFSFEIKAKEVWVRADSISFERMIRNLLSNEVKYVPCGGRVAVTLSKEGASQGVITLVDDGPGISPQYLKNIFKRSQRGLACTSTNNAALCETRTTNREEIRNTSNSSENKNPGTLTEKGRFSSDYLNERINTRNSDSKEIPRGAGLGLYQVAQTIASMGGSIKATNRPLPIHSDAHNKETKRAFGGLQIALSFPVDAFLA